MIVHSHSLQPHPFSSFGAPKARAVIFVSLFFHSRGNVEWNFLLQNKQACLYFFVFHSSLFLYFCVKIIIYTSLCLELRLKKHWILRISLMLTWQRKTKSERENACYSSLHVRLSEPKVWQWRKKFTKNNRAYFVISTIQWPLLECPDWWILQNLIDNIECC